MTNRLVRIDANPVTRLANYTYNFSDVSTGIKSLKRDIVTKEDYIAWLKEWKAFHVEIVDAIKFYRAIKNRMKVDVAFANSTSNPINDLWYLKKQFGRYARTLYQMRTDHKEAYKASLIEKTTEAA